MWSPKSKRTQTARDWKQDWVRGTESKEEREARLRVWIYYFIQQVLTCTDSLWARHGVKGWGCRAQQTKAHALVASPRSRGRHTIGDLNTWYLRRQLNSKKEKQCRRAQPSGWAGGEEGLCMWVPKSPASTGWATGAHTACMCGSLPLPVLSTCSGPRHEGWKGSKQYSVA